MILCQVCSNAQPCFYSTDLRNGWKIISPSKSFVVYAATAVEKQQWISHIKKCVSDLLVKRKYMYFYPASCPVRS